MYIKRECNLKKLLTYFFCDNIWSENFLFYNFIIKLVFRGIREFYLSIFKDCVVKPVQTATSIRRPLV